MAGERCPSGKVPYVSQESARLAALAIRRAGRGKSRHGATWYRCPDCGSWHTSAYRKHSGHAK